jgi:hypothetical protein
MTKWLALAAALAAMTLSASAPATAQGVVVGVPGVGGVQIGEQDRPRYRERGRFRDRAVRYDRDCRTITIERRNGSVKRIRRCN